MGVGGVAMSRGPEKCLFSGVYSIVVVGEDLKRGQKEVGGDRTQATKRLYNYRRALLDRGRLDGGSNLFTWDHYWKWIRIQTRTMRYRVVWIELSGLQFGLYIFTRS